MAHEDVFKFIKVLTINPKQENALENFRAAMADNYGLGIRESVLDDLDDDDCECGEHHHHHHADENNYGSMARWVNQPPEAINKLPVGTMFKGITHDSLMFTYQILGKTNEGEKLWYPVDNLPAVVVKFTEIDPNTSESKVIFVEPTDVAIDMAMKVCKPGFFYQITDVNNVPTSIFDDDEDDEDESPMAGIYFCYMLEGDDQVDFRSVTSILDSLEYIDKFQASYNTFVAAANKKAETADTEPKDLVEQPEAKTATSPIFNNDPDDFVF